MTVSMISALAILCHTWIGLSPYQVECPGGRDGESVSALQIRVSSAARHVLEEELDWIVVKDDQALIYWAFVREHHPAYPSVVLTAFVPSRGRYLDTLTLVHCEAEAAVCDELRSAVSQMSASVVHP